jgi:hypothetical protein
VAARRHPGGDLSQVQAHRFRVAPRQDKTRDRAALGADRAEDVGGRGPLVLRCGGSGAAPRPTPGELVLLPDPGFVAEPDLYVAGIEAVLVRNRRQQGREVFLNASTAPAAWA